MNDVSSREMCVRKTVESALQYVLSDLSDEVDRAAAVRWMDDKRADVLALLEALREDFHADVSRRSTSFRVGNARRADGSGLARFALFAHREGETIGRSLCKCGHTTKAEAERCKLALARKAAILGSKPKP